MTDVRTELRRISGLIEVPDRSFERLVARREQERRRKRLAAAAVALVVAVAAFGGIAALAPRLNEDPPSSGVGWEPSRRLDLRPGEYFYLRITSDVAVDGHARDEETWWATDGSGQVRNRSTRQDKYPYPPTGVFAEGEFPELNDLSSLSDPGVLEARLREGTFEGYLALLLETPYASPELRAAVF